MPRYKAAIIFVIEAVDEEAAKNILDSCETSVEMDHSGESAKVETVTQTLFEEVGA